MVSESGLGVPECKGPFEPLPSPDLVFALVQ